MFAAVAENLVLPLVFMHRIALATCAVANLQAVPGSTQYEPLQLPEKELSVLLESEALALFLERVWPR